MSSTTGTVSQTEKKKFRNVDYLKYLKSDYDFMPSKVKLEKQFNEISQWNFDKNYFESSGLGS